MKTYACHNYKLAIKNWGVSLFLGIIFIGLAISAIFSPFNDVLLSIFMSMCGIFEFTFFEFNKYTSPCWHWYDASEVFIDFDGHIPYVIKPPE